MIAGPLGQTHDSVAVLANERVAKLAALLFDSVIPLGAEGVPAEVLAFGMPELWNDGALLMMSRMRERLSGGRPIRITDDSGMEFVSRNDDLLGDVDLMEKLLQRTYVSEPQEFAKRCRLALENSGLPDVALMLPFEALSLQSSGASQQPSTAVAVVADGLDVVDVSEISWEEILEARTNPGIMRGLRSLRRLFLLRGTGNDPGGTDVIRSALDEYTEAARTQGLPLRRGKVALVASSAARHGGFHADLPGWASLRHAELLAERSGPIAVAGVEFDMRFVAGELDVLADIHPAIFGLGID